MMESHLEALFFPFLCSDFFTMISSLWTWVAACATAVSFWGIKSVGSHALSTGEDESLLFHHQQQLQEDSQEPVEESKHAPPCPCHLSSGVLRPCIGGGTTKTKFIVYLEDSGCVVAKDRYLEGEEIEYFNDVVDNTVCCWESCDQFVFVKRSMDFGWYNYQDLTVLDGSVVKLWKVERRRPSSAKGTLEW